MRLRQLQRRFVGNVWYVGKKEIDIVLRKFLYFYQAWRFRGRYRALRCALALSWLHWKLDHGGLDKMKTAYKEGGVEGLRKHLKGETQ